MLASYYMYTVLREFREERIRRRKTFDVVYPMHKPHASQQTPVVETCNQSHGKYERPKGRMLVILENPHC